MHQSGRVTQRQTSDRSKLRALYRLIKGTPGLTTYLVGGVFVWAITRGLETVTALHHALGALLIEMFRLAGLFLVGVLFFRRTGQLAAARADLARLRTHLEDSGTGRIWPMLLQGLIELLGRQPRDTMPES